MNWNARAEGKSDE